MRGLYFLFQIIIGSVIVLCTIFAFSKVNETAVTAVMSSEEQEEARRKINKIIEEELKYILVNYPEVVIVDTSDLIYKWKIVEKNGHFKLIFGVQLWITIETPVGERVELNFDFYLTGEPYEKTTEYSFGFTRISTLIEMQMPIFAYLDRFIHDFEKKMDCGSHTAFHEGCYALKKLVSVRNTQEMMDWYKSNKSLVMNVLGLIGSDRISVKLNSSHKDYSVLSSLAFELSSAVSFDLGTFVFDVERLSFIFRESSDIDAKDVFVIGGVVKMPGVDERIYKSLLDDFYNFFNNTSQKDLKLLYLRREISMTLEAVMQKLIEFSNRYYYQPQ